jgi:hypothetical protein
MEKCMMKTVLRSGCGVTLFAALLLFSTCNTDTLPEPGEIAWTAAADGREDSVTSTVIAFTFSDAVEGLTKNDIVLAGDRVAAGALAGGGKNWSLALAAVTAAGDLTVSIRKDGIEAAEKTVTVHRANAPELVTYSVVANGAAETTTTTAIAFTFSAAVTGLTAEDVTLADDTGAVTKGALSGAGTAWSLGITVTSAGKVRASINRSGIETTEKTVTVHKAAAPVLPVTADIEYTGTKNNSSGTEFDITAWTGQGTADESWTLTAMEQNVVYFAAYKESYQTITVGGDDAARVSQATGTMDGTLSSGALAVFAVDTRSLVFEGGTRSFTLNVSEDGALPKTVTVTLNVEPNETGAALFKVKRETARVNPWDPLDVTGGGITLTRLDSDSPVPFTGFQAALEWLEENAEADTEYLIRVEKDEELPRLVISLNNAANATLRLRGTQAGGPKVLRHDGTSAVINKKNLSETGGRKPFILIGVDATTNTIARTFILGSNITVKGTETVQSAQYKALIGVAYNATLVLEKDAAITGHYYSTSSAYSGPIYIAGSNANPTPSDRCGKVRIEGGSITNCFFVDSGSTNDASYLITVATNATWAPAGVFYKAASTPENPIILTGNANNKITFWNNATYTYDLTDAEASYPLAAE